MNNRKKQILISSISLFIVIMIFVIILAQPKLLDTSEQSTKDFIISTNAYECNFLCNLLKPLQQTTFFSTSEYTASVLYAKTIQSGNSITFYTRSACTNYNVASTALQDFQVTLHITAPDGVETAISKKLFGITNFKEYYTTSTITPLKTGTYKVYDELNCFAPGTLSPVTFSTNYKHLTRTFIVASGPVTCQPDKFLRTCSSDSFPRCNTNSGSYSNVDYNGCEEWTHNSGPDCLGSSIYLNCKTQCDNGAYCDNSYSSSLCDGKVNCVKKPVIECSSDLSISCPDGSSIIQKSCVDGKYTITNNVCPIPSVEECPTGTSGVYPDCVSDESVCPVETTGVFPDCIADITECPTGTSGTYPNCVLVNNNTNCTKDITIKCSDSSTIITYQCLSGKYTATNNKCAIVNTCPSGTTGTYPDCVEETSSTLNKVLFYGMIVSIVGLIGFIIYKLYKSKK
jgi:hypothetical protein